MDSPSWSRQQLTKLGVLLSADAREARDALGESMSGLSPAAISTWTERTDESPIFLVAHGMDFSTPVHTHDYYEFSYVVDGSILNVVDGRKLYMLPGSLCVMNLNSSHTLQTVDKDAIIVNLCLRKELFSEGFYRQFITQDSPLSAFLRGDGSKSHLFFTDSANMALQRAFSDIMEAYTSSSFKTSCELAARVLLLLDRLSKTPTYSYYGIDAKAMSIMAYIRDNCDKVSIKHLARTFGYSENYFTQYIRNHTGRSASELIADARVARAELLLRTTDMNVSSIAAAVGYRSIGHFNELFRAYHDMTPGDYRKLARAL